MKRSIVRLTVCSAALFVLAVSSVLAQTVQLVNAFPGITFSKPLFLTHAPDSTNRIFVVQENGLIVAVPNDSASAAAGARVFLNITNKLSSTGGEEGLLGLAFHPQFASNGYFFVNYTAPSPLHTVVARYRVSTTDPNKADSLSEYKIIEIDQPYSNHNGGGIAFGPDGYLYIGTGDGGSGDDPGNRAQNRTVLLGKFLRINVDDTTATRHYTIPPDNPYYQNTQGYREEIWTYGMRNPFRWSFDPVTGELWVGDVGQSAREEVDRLEGGRNYGWRQMEGSICNPAYSCDTAGFNAVPPVKDYGRSLGSTVTGGYVYRGYRRTDLGGAYVYGDFGSGRIWSLRDSSGILTEDRELIDSPYSISSFGTDQNGELYVVTFSYSGNTSIYRFAGAALTDVPVLGLATPAGGETYDIGRSYPVRWITNNVRGTISVELTRDGGVSYETVSANAYNLGGISWTVTGPATQNARIRIRSNVNGALVDSSNLFAIVQPPVIALSVPNGGETWQYGSSHAVVWTALAVDSVDLSYRTSPAGAWNPIASGVPGAPGSYDWLIPDDPTTQARVRVADASNGSVLDESNANFTITVPAVAVTPSPVDFGEVQIITTALDTVQIQNAGTGTLAISKILIDSSAFAVSRQSLLIAPGGSDTLIVFFSPTDARGYAGTMSLNTNAPGSPTVVTLQGIGAIINGAGGGTEPLPTALALYQNYPNPFNPATTIRYALPSTGIVTLKVYDMLGRDVATLVNGVQEAGYKSVQWNVGTLSSGVYLYRLTVGGWTSVRKLLVMK